MIENEIHIMLSCNKYDNIRRKAFNEINEVIGNRKYGRETKIFLC